MSTKALYRHAATLYNCGDARIDRHNRRAWVRSIKYLGDKWLLAKNCQRLT